jgi:hypothetical protein
MSIVPQWPRVVTATMLQLPSEFAAIEGGGKTKLAAIAVRETAQMRWPIMGVPLVVFYPQSDRNGGVLAPVPLPPAQTRLPICRNCWRAYRLELCGNDAGKAYPQLYLPLTRKPSCA